MRSPELKAEIQEKALSNYSTENISQIQKMIEAQRTVESGMGGDGKLFTACEEYFLQRILETEQAQEVLAMAREDINDGYANDFSDPLQHVTELMRARDGDLVEDLTPNEAGAELGRVFASPEYKEARVKELGYEPGHHPDKEIQAYLDAFLEWTQLSPMDRGKPPVKPKDYEQRLEAPSKGRAIEPQEVFDDGPSM